jgi:predicted acylesterase/phospholipase RssA
LLTGSNLATGRTEIFSAEHTPQFPVADAVRISMSLPFIYKPYVIDGLRPGWPPCGTYVDGGLWNNLPFREFNEASSSDDSAFDGAPTSQPDGTGRGFRPQTLALRLSIDPPEPVRNLGDFLKRVATFGLFGSGESQVLSRYSNQTILLDTEGLDLVTLSPPQEIRERATRRARRAVWTYFDRSVPRGEIDEADDAAIKRRTNLSNACP